MAAFRRARDRAVCPFPVGVVARQDERVPAGGALRRVGGRRVPVLECRTPGSGSASEEVIVEFDRAVPDRDAE